jgi:hypothetical protein
MYKVELTIVEPTRGLAEDTANWLRSILPPFKGDATMQISYREIDVSDPPLDAELAKVYADGQDATLALLAGMALGIN